LGVSGKMKKVLLIGNRPKVFEEIIKFKELTCAYIFAVKDSFLHRRLIDTDCEYTPFGIKNKKHVIQRISETGFDILISNGCPFVIPVSQIRKPHQLFINIHPSLLPDLRGAHPVNGALLFKRGFTGATMHYMDDSIDTGYIIYQEKADITDDLDLGLVYQMTFDLEARVFSIGMKRIIDAIYDYQGENQIGTGSYYSRSQKDMMVDFESMSNDEIITRVRAFGIKSQGVSCAIDGENYTVFDAELILNRNMLNKYENYSCGTLLLKYDDKLLVKARNGIIKIKSYKKG
jgi:methionyl-tRNA formyltransferase